ncbi:hypothetical protein SLS53_006132 [Cytospora paraplurivora]|uniref:Uncharacterized protein n=1 Tax=Cytospora paraplurivora TaxID=2898453 RepID=A0AAN9UAN3_9PEZI
MAPSAQNTTAQATDIENPDYPFLYHIIRLLVDFIANIRIREWITHVVRVVGGFFSGIWQSIVNFLRAALDQLASSLLRLGRYILEILSWAGGLLLAAALWLLKWAAIILVSSMILLLALDAAVKYLDREKRTNRHTPLLASNWQSSNHQTFVQADRGQSSLPNRSRWFNFNRTGSNRPPTSSTDTQTSGTGAGQRHPSSSGYGSNRQANDEAGRERQSRQEKAAQEEERRRKERETQRKEQERRRREEAAQREKLNAEALSRAFAAWIKRVTDMTTEDMTRMGRIPDPPRPDVPLQCGEACREARAGRGSSFCTHSMRILVENHAMVNGIKREEFVRKLVRAVHPDNQKFIRSDARVREQAAEMTKILNGML